MFAKVRTPLPIIKNTVVRRRFVGMASAAQPTKRREPPPLEWWTPAKCTADADKSRDNSRRFHEARQVTIPKMQSLSRKTNELWKQQKPI